MEIKDKGKFIQYYVGIFKGMQTTGMTFFPEKKTPEEKAQAVLETGFWNVKIVFLSTAKVLENLGYLNVGICPQCRESPIGRDNSWPYSWGWNNGPTLYLCKDCYDIGMQGQLERGKNRKGCYIATVCYGDEFSENVFILQWYKDAILTKNRFGKLAVNIYYFVSPTIAKYLQNKKGINNLIRKLLLDPITFYIKRKHMQ